MKTVIITKQADKSIFITNANVCMSTSIPNDVTVQKVHGHWRVVTDVNMRRHDDTPYNRLSFYIQNAAFDLLKQWAIDNNLFSLYNDLVKSDKDYMDNHHPWKADHVLKHNNAGKSYINKGELFLCVSGVMRVNTITSKVKCNDITNTIVTNEPNNKILLGVDELPVPSDIKIKMANTEITGVMFRVNDKFLVFARSSTNFTAKSARRLKEILNER